MKLQRLAGFGPATAFVSAVALVVTAVFQQVTLPPGLLVAEEIVYLLAFFVWVGSLTVTLFDLEWLEHPATSTGLFRIALAAILIAMVMPGVIALVVFARLSIPLEIPWSVMLAGIGVSLVIHNIEARRARLLHGALPWIGIVAGGLFTYLGILEFVYMFTPVLVMGFVYGMQPAQLLYLVWAIWMGVHLIRARSKAKVPASVAATA